MNHYIIFKEPAMFSILDLEHVIFIQCEIADEYIEKNNVSVSSLGLYEYNRIIIVLVYYLLTRYAILIRMLKYKALGSISRQYISCSPTFAIMQ